MAWPLVADEGSVIGSKWRVQGPFGSCRGGSAQPEDRRRTQAAARAPPGKAGHQGLARLKAEAACWSCDIPYKSCLLNVTCVQSSCTMVPCRITVCTSTEGKVTDDMLMVRPMVPFCGAHTRLFVRLIRTPMALASAKPQQ